MAKRPASPVTRGIMSDSNKSAFWEGFVDGFTRASKYSIPIALALAAGLALGSYSHPYEVCKRMYDTPEDISECVWIKENP
jgi:hypothetical protein